jgi:hypothetical protein
MVARLFSYQKSKFGYIFEGLDMENGVFYDNLEYFMATWCILRLFWYTLWSFGIYFAVFWYVWTKKNLATLVNEPLVS